MDFLSRLQNLQQVLLNSFCEALLIEDTINLYYLTGIELSAGKLMVDLQGACLYVDSRYLEMCQKKSPFPVKQYDPSHPETLFESPELFSIKSLAFDSQNTSFKNYHSLERLIGSLSSRSPKIQLVPLDSPLQQLRAIKSAAEIELLKEAANLGSQGFDFVCTLLQEGISEQELALELEIFWKRRGSKTVAFDPIIAFGVNSSMPHYRAGEERLKPGHIVLIDIGVNYKNYHSDMTRVVFFGPPDSRLLEIHTIVKKAQQLALSLCHPGTLLGTLDSIARDFIASQGFGPNFSHSLGHGLGLNIHEYPFIRNTPPYKDISLSPGMVVTIEPGIYLPGVGGVRLEDSVVITEKGYENLTQRTTEPHFLG